MKSGLYWHAYHHPRLLFLVDDYDARVNIIKTTKPKNEQEDRLRWFKEVAGQLPVELIKAFQAQFKANQVWFKSQQVFIETNPAIIKAEQVFIQATRGFRKIYRKHLPAIEKLHTEECPNCTWDGMKLVFEKRTAK